MSDIESGLTRATDQEEKWEWPAGHEPEDEPVAEASGTDEEEPAPASPPRFYHRFQALVYDTILGLLLGLGVLIPLSPFLGYSDWSEFLPWLALAGVLAFYALIEANKQASPGKLLVGLQLASSRPYPLAWLLLRNALKYAAALPVALLVILLPTGALSFMLEDLANPQTLLLLAGLGLFALNLVALAWRRTTLHDALAGTVVQARHGWEPKLSTNLARTALFSVGGLGLVAAVAMPNFVGGCGRSTISSVKANMHTLQTMVETYAVDWGGQYPANVDQLFAESNIEGKAYWKDFRNPFSGHQGKGKSFADEGASRAPGLASYSPIGPAYTQYFIYGYDKKGQRIHSKGTDFFLTNS